MVYIMLSDCYSLLLGYIVVVFVMVILIGYIYFYWYVVVFCWVGLIGLVWVLLGVYFLSDVIVGVLFGMGSVIYVMSVMEKSIWKYCMVFKELGMGILCV